MDEIGKLSLYFKLTSESYDYSRVDIPKEYDVIIWKPSILNLKPPGKPLKYVFYWLFYYFKIFKNRYYRAFLLYYDNLLVHSFLVVPAHFKWPYMGKNDVQIIYVMTHKSYRGRGLAVKCIRKMINELKNQVDSFWYVTDSKNQASIRVAEKLGFKKVLVRP